MSSCYIPSIYAYFILIFLNRTTILQNSYYIFHFAAKEIDVNQSLNLVAQSKLLLLTIPKCLSFFLLNYAKSVHFALLFTSIPSIFMRPWLMRLSLSPLFDPQNLLLAPSYQHLRLKTFLSQTFPFILRQTLSLHGFPQNLFTSQSSVEYILVSALITSGK